MAERDDGRQMGSGRRETYQADDLTKMAEKLEALPDAGGRRGLSRPNAVKFLEPQIEALRKKNYTTKEICEALTEVGLKITPAQLLKLMPVGKSAARGVKGAAGSASKAGSGAERRSQAGGSKTAAKGDKGKSNAAAREPQGFSVKPDRLEI